MNSKLRALISGRLGCRHGLTTSRHHLDRMVCEFAASVPERAVVLDAGAGDSPYRYYFSHTIYEAADLCDRDSHDYTHVNYVCDLVAIPVPSSRYDAALCTQVLEHMPNPQQVLSELWRVLKPGGRLWLSTPLYFEEHEVPSDFFRYTQYGLRRLMAGAGFDVLDLGWISGYFGTLAHQLNIARHELPWHPRDYGGGLRGAAAAGLSLLIRPLWLPLGLFFAYLDLRHRYTQGGHTMDYYVVASKRSK